MLKPKLEPTVIACLAGRDAQYILYTDFVQTPSSNKNDCISSQASAMPMFTRPPFLQEHNNLFMNDLLNSL